MPIMLETSVQAQYMIPMAISLSFGIVFATVITLFLIPSLYMLQIDGFARTRWVMSWLFDRQSAKDASETV
jgi:Cu/Ag efflux pump CusA